MTAKGAKKKTFDIPIEVLKVINVAILKESTQEKVLSEKEMFLIMIKESATFQKYEKQIK